MINKNFVSKSCWIHKIHPTLRVFTAILYGFFVALFYRLPTLSLALVVSVLMVLSVGFKFKFVLEKLFLLSSFLLLIWIALPLSCWVEMLTDASLIQVGCLLALQITIKTFAIALSFMVLISTMDLVTLAYSLRSLRVPKKMVHLTLITHRYIFLIEREYRKLLSAITVRNFHPRTNMHTYKTYSYLLGMLFVRAYERGKRVNNAMICRNFNGEFFSTHQNVFNRQSFIFLLCTGLLLTMLLLFELQG